nr:histidine phosphatase family protein [Motilibacter aurantiacus]
MWLARHGESTGNVADRTAREAGSPRLELSTRDPDVPLTDTGRAQAQSLGGWLSRQAGPPTVALCSPYARASSTAEIALRAAGIELPLVRDERLRERDLGVLDGYTGAGIRQAYPEESARRDHLGKFYYRPPGGESWSDVALRVRSVLDSIRLDCGGQDVLVVAHEAVIMVFRYVLEGLTEQEVLAIQKDDTLANASVTTYGRSGASLRLRTYNETTHLQAQGAAVTDEPDVPAGDV